MIEALTRVTDSYERQARLYPALLAMAPLMLTMTCLYGGQATLLKTFVSVLAGCGALFWVSNLARDAGKSLEKELFTTWGGKPSVQLLRHRDPHLDPITKQRHHNFLATSLKISLPSPEEEQENPNAADQIYESATRWLLEKTRDTKKFPLLLKENIAYGFRRNLLGVRWAGIVAVTLSLIWISLVGGLIRTETPYLATNLPVTTVAAYGGSVLLLSVWIFGVSSRRVRVAAFAYAERLLAACETLRPETPKSPGHQKGQSA